MGLNGNRKYSDTVRYGQVWLGKRADSGVWYAQFRHPLKGTYTLRSLGTTLKKEAIKKADHLSAQLTNREIGRADGMLPLDVMFDEFLKAKESHLKFEAAKRVRSSINVFQRWLAANHPSVQRVKQVTPAIIRGFQRQRKAGGTAERTVDNDITNLHTVGRWAEVEGLIDKSPFDYSRGGPIDLFDAPGPELHTYTPEEYDKLVVAADTRGDLLIRDLIILLANTGMRFGEATHLVPASCHWKGEMPCVEIRARNGWTPKDPREVKFVPMSPAVEQVLRRRCRVPEGTYLFTNSVGNEVAENHSRTRLKRLFPLVGIGPGRRLHWHSWRNYFVIRCLDAGIPVHVIMTWTGHDTASMVLHYAKAKMRDKVGFAEFRKLL